VKNVRYEATVNLKNKSNITCEVNADSLKEAASKIRRKYPNKHGFKIKPLNW